MLELLRQSYNFSCKQAPVFPKNSHRNQTKKQTQAFPHDKIPFIGEKHPFIGEKNSFIGENPVPEQTFSPKDAKKLSIPAKKH